MSSESQGIALLSASLIRPVALAVAAWLILRLFRIRHPASQHAVWTTVLLGVMLLPFLSVVTPHWSVPVLPSEAASPAEKQVSAIPAAPMDTEIRRMPPVDASAMPSKAPSLEPVILGLYLCGLFAMLAYQLTGWVLLQRIVSRSVRLRRYGSRVTWLVPLRLACGLTLEDQTKVATDVLVVDHVEFVPAAK